MKTLRISLHLLVVAFLVLAFSAVASAQATRTWVSGVGDDANPCSRTAPCKTFAGAISKTATGGEIDCLDEGGFGQVTITKAITIDCDSGPGGILAGAGNGININAAGAAVNIRSLNINGISGATNGINISAAATVHLVDMNIYNCSGSGVNVNVSATVFLSMQNVNVHECVNGLQTNATGAGILAVADLDHVAVWRTTNGIQAQNGSRINVTNSSFFGTTTGINQNTLAGGGSQVTVVNSSFSFSQSTAMQSILGASIGASGNVFTANALVFNQNGGTITSAGDNVLNGNGGTGALGAGGIFKI